VLFTYLVSRGIVSAARPDRKRANLHAMSGREQRGSEVVVARAAADSIHRGHPWVWRSAVTKGLERVTSGDVVQLVGGDGTRLGVGVAEPGSPIAVRVWATGPGELDEALVEARVVRAMAVRAALFGGDGPDTETTAYRLVHGEGDRMPGFVVDRYGHVAVLRLDGDAASAFAGRVVPHLWKHLQAAGVRTLVQRATGQAQGGGKGGGAGGDTKSAHLLGEPMPDVIDVKEHGVPFVVDLARGQKTGAFLDQRENRKRVQGIVATRKAKRVLNLFSYAGGFSLRAALGGAERVTSVDIAAGAHATAHAGFKRAGVDPKAHEFVTADAFTFLAEAKRAKRTWDVVVSDPPSFAPSEKALARATQAYRALHRACADVLADGGVFCAASCSSHVDALTFASTLDDGALGRGDLRLLSMHGPGEDHPTVPAWPEGRYLKFAVLA
jgi:23S rRNA (cytosine1962-C5)-methyltransferase